MLQIDVKGFIFRFILVLIITLALSKLGPPILLKMKSSGISQSLIVTTLLFQNRL